MFFLSAKTLLWDTAMWIHLAVKHSRSLWETCVNGDTEPLQLSDDGGSGCGVFSGDTDNYPLSSIDNNFTKKFLTRSLLTPGRFSSSSPPFMCLMSDWNQLSVKNSHLLIQTLLKLLLSSQQKQPGFMSFALFIGYKFSNSLQQYFIGNNITIYGKWIRKSI